MATTDVPARGDRPGRVRPPAPPRPFSDKTLMDNAEGDRKILQRARDLADRRNNQAR